MQPHETEHQILEQIRRYKLTIERLLPTNAGESATLAIQRLVQARRISQWEHASGLRYWTRYAKYPLSTQSLIGAVGILTFLHQSAGRSAITSGDMSTYFPDLFRRGLPRGYFIERNGGQSFLGLAKVDSCSSISRIVSRTLRCIDKHRANPGFRSLIEDDRFKLVWIMPTQEKCKRIAAVMALCQASQVSVRSVAIPELLEVIAPIPPL